MNLTFLFSGIMIGCILGTFVDRYLLPIGDNILQAFVNRKTLEATKIQRDITIVEKDIRDIRMSAQQSEIQAIGFRHEEDGILDEEYEECEDYKIGFRSEKTK